MFYKLSSVKNNFLSNVDRNKVDPQLIKNFFLFRNLFDEKIMNPLYLINSKFFISSDQLMTLIDKFGEKFGYSLKYKTFRKTKTITDKFEVITNDCFYRFMKALSLIEVNKNEFNIETEIRMNRLLDINTKMPFDLLNKNILSIDFEYTEFKGNILINEVGISTYKNGEINNYHYLINQKNNPCDFLFGKTQNILINDLFPILDNFISDADYILGHSLDMELKVLDNNNYDMTNLSSKVYLDTSRIIYNEFQSVNEKHIRSQQYVNYMSLRESLFISEIEHSGLHNSGNDSAFTLMLLLKLNSIREKYLSNNESCNNKIILHGLIPDE